MMADEESNDKVENLDSTDQTAADGESEGTPATTPESEANREPQANQHYSDISFPIMESENMWPDRPIEQSQSDNFNLLLRNIPQHLDQRGVRYLISWADITYRIEARNIMEMLNKLKEQNIIGPLHLSVLRDEFQKMEQIHLVHLMDNYLLGDYQFLNSPPNHPERSREHAASSFHDDFKDLPTTNDSKLSVDMGSNGQKLSKFPREDSQRNSGGGGRQDSNDDVNEEWLCNHYKRRCHVKFACCDKYWPCHRCHNNESNCGQKKLKSIHTKFVKCVKCGTEQEFTQRSQYCCNCNTKFAQYFCATCKHLTGNDEEPYHCNKCGICRIHKRRSFHCDTCGVCLDVQLESMHECSEKRCVICYQDLNASYEVLPCSHKFHKKCLRRRGNQGFTSCPICRERFAHKLEKHPARPPRKHEKK